MGSSIIQPGELKSNPKRDPEPRNAGHGNRGDSRVRGNDASWGRLHPDVLRLRDSCDLPIDIAGSTLCEKTNSACYR